MSVPRFDQRPGALAAARGLPPTARAVHTPEGWRIQITFRGNLGGGMTPTHARALAGELIELAQRIDLEGSDRRMLEEWETRPVDLITRGQP